MVIVTPFDGTTFIAPMEPAYVEWSYMYDSWATARLRRSLRIEAAYALPFVFANFGIAIAARIPMITTTINSSISVKPLRFMLSPWEKWLRTPSLGLKELAWPRRD